MGDEYDRIKVAEQREKERKKKKEKKKPSYYAVLIDFRGNKLRSVERQKLKIGFENVLSFTFDAQIHSIIDNTEDNEIRLSLKSAFKEYKERHLLKKEEKKVAKLVTEGFDNDEARKALRMSQEQDLDEEHKQKNMDKHKKNNKKKKKKKRGEKKKKKKKKKKKS